MMNPQQTELINMGCGIELAEEESVSAAITQEFPQWAGCESEFPIATSLQIFCNIFLLLVVFAGFVGQLRFDEKDRT